MQIISVWLHGLFLVSLLVDCEVHLSPCFLLHRTLFLRFFGPSLGIFFKVHKGPRDNKDFIRVMVLLFLPDGVGVCK